MLTQKDLIRNLRLTDDPTIILFPYTYGRADNRTVAFVKQLMEMGENTVWANVKGCTIAYGILFSGYWNRGGDLMILEHDVLPTLRMVREMATCPHEVCVQAYRLHPPNYGYPKSMLCFEDSITGKMASELHQDFTSYSGFAFIRFKASVQKKVSAIRCQWYGVDTLWCSQARKILGENFIHIHRPEMPHFHGVEVL